MHDAFEKIAERIRSFDKMAADPVYAQSVAAVSSV